MEQYSNNNQWNIPQHYKTILLSFSNAEEGEDCIQNQLLKIEKAKMRKIFLNFLKQFWTSNITLIKKKTSTNSVCILSTVYNASKQDIVKQISTCLKRLLCSGQDTIDNIEVLSYERKFILYIFINISFTVFKFII